MGWDVSVASTVAEGLELLENGPEPCCLVLDLGLPDGQGETLWERLRAKGYKTRVVVATGLVDDDRLRTISSLQPDALLRKPIDLTDVWNHEVVCRVCPIDPADRAIISATAIQPSPC